MHAMPRSLERLLVISTFILAPILAPLTVLGVLMLVAVDGTRRA